MKCELIEEKTDDPQVSVYKTGEAFSDFCRGPHIPSMGPHQGVQAAVHRQGPTGKATKKRERLQRIYGTSFFNGKDLKEHLRRLEEAKKRDHRKLGKQLDLFSIQEAAGRV